MITLRKKTLLNKRLYLLEFFQRRNLLCAALAWTAGTALGAWAAFDVAYVVGTVAALILFILHRGRSWQRVFLWLTLGLCALALCSGRMALPNLPEEGKWDVRGQVVGPVLVKEGAARFDLSAIQVQGEEDAWTPVLGKAYVWIENDTALDLIHGDQIQFVASLSLPSGQRNPGGFDLRMWMLQQGDHFSFLGRDEVTVLKPAGFSLLGMIHAFTEGIGQRIDALFGDMAPLFRAMLLGEQHLLPEEWREWFTKAGIVHLLSVSGLHVGLVYGLLSWMIAWMHPSPRLRFILLSVFLALYALMTGLSPATIRATLMLVAFAWGQVLGRKTDPITCLAGAALCILLVRPFDLFSPGFQLSFGAMAGLCLLSAPLTRLNRKAPSWMEKPLQPLTMTLAAQIGTLLPVMASYGWTSLLAPLTNLVAIPLSSLLIPFAAPVLLVDLLWHDLARIMAIPAYGIMRAIYSIAQWTGQSSFILRMAAPSPLFMSLGTLLCLLLASDALRWPILKRGICITILLGMGGIFTLLPLLPTRYVQLDVGQALSGVLHAQGACYVYDTGQDGDELVSYLLYTGEDVDALFLSHGHSDHVGGLAALLTSVVDVRCIYLSACSGGTDQDAEYYAALETAQAQGIPMIPLSQGETLDLGPSVWAEVLWPPEDHNCSDANECSLVLRVHAGATTLLLTGDIGMDQEPLRNVDCDVLQIAHHGSRYSTSEAFLRQSTPQIALISAGQNNSYGHPHPLVLERLEEIHAIPFLTGTNGAITVLLDEEALVVRPFIKEKP